ncbi:MAG: hypothetical protein WCE51_13580 [Chthoniobacterales bacterium]
MEAENQVARISQWDTQQVYDRAWAEALLRQGWGGSGKNARWPASRLF